MTAAIDLFAGPGGWDIAARQLGIDVVGIERDSDAVATRRAAGFYRTIHDDVRSFGPANFLANGLIASPPCPTFSSAGKGSGRRALNSVIEAAGHLATGGGLLAHAIDDRDERTALVLEPLRWAIEAHADGTPYQWIALEQVPAVLPVWEAYAEHLRGIGYSVATGILHAEQYGVPQMRRRAILVARLDGAVALPAPTHSRYYPRNPDRLDPGVLPWVSMAEALGWDEGVAVRSNYGTGGDPADRRVRIGSQPAWTVTSKVDRNIVYRNGNQANSARRGIDTPAPTIHFGARMNSVEWVGDVNPTRVTVQEAATLQSFPPDYPWQGTKTAQYQQVGAGRLAASGKDTKPARPISEPSFTITGVGSSVASGGAARLRMTNGSESARVTVQEAATLQSFPPDYPWQGTKTAQYQQVGNAIPPLLALRVLEQATGLHANEKAA